VQYGQAPRCPEVSIVVPLYKRIDFIHHHLTHFVQDRQIAEADLVYVLDSPELAPALTALAEEQYRLHGLPFRIITLSRNAGFSRATNIGSSMARGRLLLLFNSDLLPARPGWLGKMVAFYDATPNIGALGPKLLFEDDSLQHAGMYFYRDAVTSVWFNQHYFKGLHPRLPAANVARQVPAVTGACLMIERALYERLGGLRSMYVQGGFEDSDLCLRLMERGRQNWYVPDAELYHLEDQSFPTDLRSLTVNYNAWLHTQLWNERIEAVMSNEDFKLGPLPRRPS
jgi:GT2 family glycosyltransferase